MPKIRLGKSTPRTHYKPKTADNIQPKAESLAPRTGAQSVDRSEPDLAHTLSPLGAYLKATGITITAFSKASGLDIKSVSDHSYGITMPAIWTAYYYEILTKGRVAMEMWIATAIGKQRLQEMMDRADPEVKRQIERLPGGGGGYASPLKKGPSGPKTKREHLTDYESRVQDAEVERIVEEAQEELRKQMEQHQNNEEK